MNDELVKVLVEVLSPMLTALAVAVGGWCFSRMPGPAKDFLYANVHARDVQLLLGAMARRAAAQKSDEVQTGHGPEDLIAYVRAELPGLVAKLALSDTALATVAGATLVRAAETPVSVSPSLGADVLSESNLSVALHRSAIPGA
jgi:hypothetical protein